MALAADTSLTTRMAQLAILPPPAFDSWQCVENFYIPLVRAGLPTMASELCHLVASFLKPRDSTDVLLQATFAEFLQSGAQQETAQDVARIWGRFIPAMDYSRVFMAIDTGLLPFMSCEEDGRTCIYTQRTVSFLGRATSRAWGYIHCDLRVFPALAQTAYRRYFSHVTELINPSGTYHGLACGAAGRIGARTTEDVKRYRVQKTVPVRSDIDERVEVRDSLHVIRRDLVGAATTTATEENPLYMVDLDLQPVHDMGAGKVVNENRAPSIRITRYNGAKVPEVIFENQIHKLPDDFAERPLSQAPKSVRIYRE